MSQLLQHIKVEALQEMAMVDIAFEILKEKNRPYNFRELMDEIAKLRNLKEDQLMAIIAQVYTEVNIDGRFVCIGENTWGLKRWYPTEAVEESQEGGGKKKKAVVTNDFDDFEEEAADDFEEDDIELFEEEEEEEEEEEDFADEDDIDADDEDIDEIDEEDEEDEELDEEDELFEEEEEEEDGLEK
ncbi:DNA-directed RNA polymerase subunit delta [Brevibacillus daliensis]|uniref:DNA-directed RNA polymerase subunit delta n=1 Tax=Brevibacillus daliensis TaxID=2892995 RepID=UPI001E34034F|nr:DNA-directed RNA polymerase subunit delta [Brevibacillus daliensis]